MNLRFIEAFVWVARLRSFRAASEKLHTTQTAISFRIASLENDFGVRLFERDKRTVTLTHSGEELLKYAEELLGTSARMMEAVADRASYGGTISIGAIETVVHTWLPELLKRLRDSFPQAGVEIHSDTTANLHEALLKGNIDLAFTSESLSNASVENRPICEVQMAWVTSAKAWNGNPIAGREILEGLPLLTFLRGSSVHRDVVSKLGPHSTARINPISSIAAMVSLIKSGHGVATLPPACVMREIESGELVALDVEPALAAVSVMASVRNRSDSPFPETAASLAVEAAASFATGPLAYLVRAKV
jgi:DNA-binding transcriptional LysR family regulator